MSSLKSRRISKKVVERNFIGRREYIEKYKSSLQLLNKSEHSVINYYGVGGIGKTSLLKEIQKENDENNVLSFYYDIKTHISIFKFYEDLCVWFQEKKSGAIYLPMVYMLYWKKLNPNIDSKEQLPQFMKESGLYGDIVSAFASEVIKDFVPIVAGSMKLVFKGYKKLIEQYSLDQNIIEEIRELENKSIEEIEEALPAFLFYDMQRINEKSSFKVVFLFDTYEKLYEDIDSQNRQNVDDWVKNIIAYCENTIMFIIAGREKLLWSNQEEEWDEYISYEHLNSLSYEESKNLLKLSGIKEDDIVDAIAKSSQGLPFYINLLIDTYMENTSNNISDYTDLKLEEIFKRFIGNINTDYLVILEYLSIVRFFNREIYSYLLNECRLNDSDTVYKNIIYYSFFSEKNGYYHMHDLMRKSFKSRISSFQSISVNKIMFEFYNSKIDYSTTDADSKMIYVIREALYHLLNLNDDSIIKEWFRDIHKLLYKVGSYHLLSELYEEAIKYKGDSYISSDFLIKLGLLYSEMDKYDNVVSIINRLDLSIVPITLIDNVDYLKAKKQLNYIETKVSHTKKAKIIEKVKKHFTKVIHKSDDSELKVMAYIDIANIMRKNSDLFNAKSHLFSALKLSDEPLLKAKIYDKLGFLYRDSKSYTESKEFFLKAIDIKLKYLNEQHIEVAKSYRGLSQILNMMKQYKESQEITVKIIHTFTSFYSPKSLHVKQAYSLLVSNDIEIDIDSIDEEMLYLAMLQKAVNSNSEYTLYIDRLMSLDTDMVELYCSISEIFFSQHRQIALKFLSDALDMAVTDIDRWKVYLKYYLLYKKFKDKQNSKKYLLLLLSVSSNLGDKRYIGDLQRAASYYNHIKSFVLSYEVYMKLLHILESKRDKNKLAEIYRFLYKLHLKYKKYDKVEYYLNMEIELLKSQNRSHEIAEAKGELAAYYTKINNFDLAQQTYIEIIDIYEKLNDLNRIDMIYGKLFELYDKYQKTDEALECFYKQIQLRNKIGESTKLAKAHKFLADYYFISLNNKSEAENHLKLGLRVLQNSTNSDLYEAIHLHTYALLRFYIQTEDFAKVKDIINLRIDNANSSNILSYKLMAYEDLERYYAKIRDFDMLLKTLELELSFTNASEHPKDRLKILERIVKFYKKDRNIKKIYKYQFQMCSIYLEGKLYDDAISLLDEMLTNLSSQNEFSLSDFELNYKNILGNLIHKKAYIPYSHVIAYYKFINKKGRYTFLFDQIRRIKKKTSQNSDVFKKISTSLYNRDIFLEASIFYDNYLELRLVELKAKFDEQKILYEQAIKLLKKMNNQKITQKWLQRYDKFKIRMQNVNIKDGCVVSKILLNPLQKVQPCKEDATIIQIKQNLQQFVLALVEDKEIQEKLQSYKMVISIFLQGVKVIIPQVNHLDLGFESNVSLVRWILTDTDLVLVERIDNTLSKCLININQSVDDKYKVLQGIENYEEYVHNAKQYKILLSKCFFDGDGIFFPREDDFMDTVYTYIKSKSELFVNIKFNDMLEMICSHYSYVDENILRVENILMSMFYAGMFLEDVPYKDFEDRRLTLKFTDNELIDSMSRYGEKRLTKLLGEINIYEYSKLWIY
jgi:tetratricopeptide (TPR) repeat protein